MGLGLIHVCKMLWRAIRRDDGQDLVEYALIVALIALGATVGIGSLGTTLGDAFTNLGTSVSGAA